MLSRYQGGCAFKKQMCMRHRLAIKLQVLGIPDDNVVVNETKTEKTTTTRSIKTHGRFYTYSSNTPAVCRQVIEVPLKFFVFYYVFIVVIIP